MALSRQGIPEMPDERLGHQFTRRQKGQHLQQLTRQVIVGDIQMQALQAQRHNSGYVLVVIRR